MTLILDYGTGNLLSIKNMLRRIGHSEIVISCKLEDLLEADKLILPGVGHFDRGMSKLRDSGLIPTLTKKVLDQKTPILGICLGAQMLFNQSEEGTEKGLGWINGNVKKFDSKILEKGLKIPHMGWSEVAPSKISPLIIGLKNPSRYYFVHSYHMDCKDDSDILYTAEHGYTFTAAVARENILGVQFHPEKSHSFGMQLLDNFIKNY
jgi:glutamine amidotransferase